jgi:hypothetical protein
MADHTTRKLKEFNPFRMLNKCENKGELMVVVKDTLGNVFGGYFSQSMEVKEDYYGTGESFLFKQSKSL